MQKREKTGVCAAFSNCACNPLPPHPMNNNLQKYECADDPVSAPPPIEKGAELGFLHAALKSDISNNITEDDDVCHSDQNKSQLRVQVHFHISAHIWYFWSSLKSGQVT